MALLEGNGTMVLTRSDGSLVSSGDTYVPGERIAVSISAAVEGMQFVAETSAGEFTGETAGCWRRRRAFGKINDDGPRKVWLQFPDDGVTVNVWGAYATAFNKPVLIAAPVTLYPLGRRSDEREVNDSTTMFI